MTIQIKKKDLVKNILSLWKKNKKNEGYKHQ